RKKAEEELRARETRLASIYETVADVIFVLAVESRGTYRFTSVNPAFQAVTGVPSEAVVGMLVSEVVPEPSLSLVLGKYREAIEGKRTVRWEETSDYPAGRLTGEVSVAPIFDTEGNCVLLVGAVHDITERKRAEAEIAQLNEGLERKISERTAQLKAANRELEAFTYSVSHDLRSPLRTINGFTQILLDTEGGALSEEGRRYLGLVREGAVRMGELIEDLLQLSRFARATLERGTVDTAAMVADVIRSLQDDYAGRRVDFVIGDLPACDADGNLLRQVWLNLISNALKFTRGRSPARIEIEATTKDSQVVYSVRDNGVGFDMRYADKLFGVFQRLHRAEEYEGSGLGLAIVQRIVLRHGGTVEAKSKPGEGARFSFSLEGAAQGSRLEARPMEEER
ncbi:MAG: sensor histidine kinase, partial [Anaerolineales bacterium]